MDNIKIELDSLDLPTLLAATNGAANQSTSLENAQTLVKSVESELKKSENTPQPKDQDAILALKRQRNKEAAQRCRKKKIDTIAALEKKVKEQELTIQKKQLEIDYFRPRCEKIVELVNSHIYLGDDSVSVDDISSIVKNPDTFVSSKLQNKKRKQDNSDKSDSSS